MNFDKLKRNIIYTCSCSYALLFLYASTSKLLGYSEFRIQIGQSPIISAFASSLSIAVPLIEIVIVLLLLRENFRIYGILAGYTLMCLFTAYIYIILNYSPYVPCSCGGILEKMDWNDHMIFNIVFVLMGAVAIILNSTLKSSQSVKMANSILMLLACTIASCIIMFALFWESQNQMRYRNSLTRLFPPGLVEQAGTAELKFNSYYFAGSEDGFVYLGNSTAPLLVTVLDSTLSVRSVHNIKLNIQAKGMHAPKIKIDSPYFYLYEGSVPYIYKGFISDWKADMKINSGNNFSQLQPVGPSQAVARFTDAKATKNILGIVNLETKSIDLKPGLLSKENLFITDGILLFDKSENKVAYIHYYINRILITDANLGTALITKTIDTIEAPELKIASLKNERTFSEMPLLANRLAHFDSGWIFVNSQIIGQHESKQRWKESSIIDIYDSNNKGYLASFYIDDIEGKKARSFWVDGNSVYVLGGSKIIRYKLRKFLTP